MSTSRRVFCTQCVAFVLAALGATVASAAPAATHAVRVPAAEADAVYSLGVRPIHDLDYSSFRWLVVDDAALSRIEAGGVPFTEAEGAMTIQVQGYVFDPILDGEPAIPADLRASGDRPGLQLLQVIGPVRDEWIAQLADAGVRLLQYYPHNAYLVWSDPATMNSLEALPRDLRGAHTGTEELALSVGDRVLYVEQGGRVVQLEAEETGAGEEDAPGSRHYRWEVRLTPDQVARAIGRYGSVGRVRDIVPKRLGVSGRVVELSVQGSDGELQLRGLKVRWGLGLRENLFVVHRERGPRGEVERFVITGKGWGHGVGLCQVGAFGMAQAGSTFEEILRHYYSGVRVSPRPLL